MGAGISLFVLIGAVVLVVVIIGAIVLVVASSKNRED